MLEGSQVMPNGLAALMRRLLRNAFASVASVVERPAQMTVADVIGKRIISSLGAARPNPAGPTYRSGGKSAQHDL